MNKTIYRLVGTDEDDENALFYCDFCQDIVPFELDENGAIRLDHMDDCCPECGARIIDVILD